MSMTAFLILLGRALRARRAAICLGAAMLFLPAAANALCIAVCSCNTTITNVVFSPYNPLSGSNDDSTGSIRVSCGGVVGLLIPVTVTVGTGTSNSFTARQMSSGANKLAYNLYTSVLYSQVLGDGSSGTGTLTGSVTLDVAGIATPQIWTIYGRIPGGQSTVVPGIFADTLVVTLTYQ